MDSETLLAKAANSSKNSIHGWGRLVKPFQDLFNKITLRTQIDFIALFDHTMLHEMTHGVKKYGGDQNTATDDSGGDFGSYGRAKRSPWSRPRTSADPP